MCNEKYDRIIEQNDRIILLLEMLVGLDKKGVVTDSGDTFSIHGEYARYWFRQAGID